MHSDRTLILAQGLHQSDANMCAERRGQTVWQGKGTKRLAPSRSIKVGHPEGFSMLAMVQHFLPTQRSARVGKPSGKWTRHVDDRSRDCPKGRQISQIKPFTGVGFLQTPEDAQRPQLCQNQGHRLGHTPVSS